MDKKLYQMRLSIIQELRAGLNSRDFLEVETPALAPHSIPESTIQLFKTRHKAPGTTESSLQLLPSPEYYMKQLLADDWGNIFQFARSFRNGERGRLHSPEFTMLEYYWVDHNYMHSISLTEDLLGTLARQFLGAKPTFARMSMEEAFQQYAALPLADLCGEGSVPDDNDLIRLQETCRRLHLSYNIDDGWESLFNRIFLNFVEPQLLLAHPNTPIFLYDYPAKLQTLSLNKPGSPWTERWELYWKGMELANCFTEERDPGEIARFFRRESRAMATDPTLADPDYAEKLKTLPPCSGTALGLDRLVMILSAAEDINAVIPFPLP